jgi:transcription antitermination factor NusG
MDATDLSVAKASELDSRNSLGRPSDISRPCWYAASTRANHEKRVSDQLSARSIEHFVPLYGSIRRWKDRRVNLQLPLFPGYVFVHLALRDRLRVLQIPSVAKFVSFNGNPAALPETEIEALKAALERGIEAAPHPYVKVGRRVRIKSGPLEGLEGIVIRKKNDMRFVISLDTIQRSIRIEIDAPSVEPVHDRKVCDEGRRK